MIHVPDDVLQMQIEGYRAMSPARKLEVAAGLRAMAWSMKLAGLRHQYPDLPEEALLTRLRGFFGDVPA